MNAAVIIAVTALQVDAEGLDPENGIYEVLANQDGNELVNHKGEPLKNGFSLFPLINQDESELINQNGQTLHAAIFFE